MRRVVEYACPVCHTNLPIYLSDNMEMIQKRAVKAIFAGMSYVDIVTDYPSGRRRVLSLHSCSTRNCGPATIVNARFIHFLYNTISEQHHAGATVRTAIRLKRNSPVFPLLLPACTSRLLTSFARMQDSLKHPLQCSHHSHRLPPHAEQPSLPSVTPGMHSKTDQCWL